MCTHFFKQTEKSMTKILLCGAKKCKVTVSIIKESQNKDDGHIYSLGV